MGGRCYDCDGGDAGGGVGDGAGGNVDVGVGAGGETHCFGVIILWGLD